MSSLFKSGDWFRLVLSKKYDDDYKEGVHFVRDVAKAVDECKVELHSRLKQALAIRSMRAQREKPLKDFREMFLPAFGAFEAQLVGDLYLTDAEGLIGEIITEIMAEHCFSDFRIIYINWRRTGHSNREGMDLVGVWDKVKVDHLVLVDSKFCNGEPSNGSTYVRQTLTKAVEGLEKYHENEVKLGRAFKWKSEQELQTPTPIEELAKLYNLFESKPHVGVSSVVVCVSADFDTIINSPPKAVESCKLRTAFSLLDFVGCEYVTELVEATAKPS